MKKIYFNEIDKFIKEYDYLFVYCFTIWCGECKMSAPIVEELEAEWKDKIEFVKINVDDEYMWSGEKNGKFEILNVPTFLLFKNGKEIWREQNFKSKEIFAAALNEIFDEK